MRGARRGRPISATAAGCSRRDRKQASPSDGRDACSHVLRLRSGAPSRTTKSPASGCRRSRPSRCSRATTSRPSPTPPRRSCSRCSPPVPRLLAGRADLGPHRGGPRHHRHLLPSDDPGLPGWRRQLHRRRREPRTGRARRRGGASHRLRADGLGQRRGRHPRAHLRLPGLWPEARRCSRVASSWSVL